MTLRQIEFFIAVFESRSFSKAAKALYVSQQTISKAIRQLERELSHELFVRTSEGVEPNAYAERMYGELKDIQARIGQIPHLLASMGEIACERLEVAVAFGVLGALAQDLFETFREAYPQVDVRLADAPDFTVEERLLSGEADVGIGVGPIDTSLFDARLLRREHMYMCIHKDHPLYNAQEITMDDLRDCKFLNMTPQFKSYFSLISCCRNYGFDPNIVFTSNEIVTIKEMSEANMGISMMPTSKAHSSCPDVKFVQFPDNYYNYSLFLITKKDKPLTRPAHQFVAFMARLYRDPDEVLL